MDGKQGPSCINILKSIPAAQSWSQPGQNPGFILAP